MKIPGQEPGRGGLAYNRNNYRKPLLLMLSVVGMVMMVACANLGGLSLARGVARQHELAVRAALGAGPWRLVRQSLTASLVLALLGGGLASLALLLSSIGLYGLTAYHVARRTAEIAIRMALGATRRNIAVPVLREALLLGGIGVAVGVPLALVLSRLIQSQLYGVKPSDPFSLSAAVFALLLVAVAAAWIPARCAAKVDPMVALRAE